MRGRFLLDRDRRRQALDVIDVGLFHDREELPRIGRQRLDVAALAFGINGVEGQRGLAGTGQAGDHDQAVARQVDVDVLEVVRARAANADHVHGQDLARIRGTQRATITRHRDPSKWWRDGPVQGSGAPDGECRICLGQRRRHRATAASGAMPAAPRSGRAAGPKSARARADRVFARQYMAHCRCRYPQSQC